MQKFGTLADAIALAEFAHRNQRDKAEMPYIDHPKRVLATDQAQGARPYVQIAAVLHDVIEDTPFDGANLSRLGFTESAVRLVELLTRRPDVPPQRYYKDIKNNPDALMIKAADIADNTLEWRITHLDPETQVRLRQKYAKAKEALGLVPVENDRGHAIPLPFPLT